MQVHRWLTLAPRAFVILVIVFPRNKNYVYLEYKKKFFDNIIRNSLWRIHYYFLVIRIAFYNEYCNKV